MGTPRSFEPPLTRALAYPARVAILGVVVERPDERLGASEIASEANLSPSTFHDHREELIDLGLLEKHDGEGYPSYSLADTDQTAQLAELNATLSRVYAEREDYAASVEEFVE
ncbi:winged helix-turn-helix domain-containing protein [Haloarchaeobius amylolyticus]|uniref:winged helix-turn-helix domain-containing protein n=1 Tax=Haloarchaeobius amylolyticus TaxID=1198296 RepID=UPI00226D9739|nr:winged helix-turn-helix domain-containing protein [Haloarchaeobius amylolyticus]